MDALLADCNYDLDEVVSLATSLVAAPERCCHTPYYIQAISTGRTRFLSTNLMHLIPEVTPIASTWLLGRSSVCAIVVAEQSVSRCHAVIGHHSTYGFYITDIGSSNGTRVNGRSLLLTERRSLQNSDLLQLGKLKVEFFTTERTKPIADLDETACFKNG